MIEPEPLQTFRLQSCGVCELVGVFRAVLDTPHMWLIQVRLWHSVSLPGHWLGALHWTQAPAPSQKVPPLWLHEVLRADGGLEGTPLVQTLSVHWLLSLGT